MKKTTYQSPAFLKIALITLLYFGIGSVLLTPQNTYYNLRAKVISISRVQENPNASSSPTSDCYKVQLETLTNPKLKRLVSTCSGERVGSITREWAETHSAGEILTFEKISLVGFRFIYPQSTDNQFQTLYQHQKTYSELLPQNIAKLSIAYSVFVVLIILYGRLNRRSAMAVK